jgi:group I intron endonuclease
MKSFVYEIKNLKNGKIYVGKSNNPHVRFKCHKRYGTSKISRAISKYGVDSFEFKIVGEFQNEEEAYFYEKKLIESYILAKQELYNLSAGGRGILLTPFLREKMNLVWNNKNRLKKISDASKRNWSNPSFRSNISLKIKNHFEKQDIKLKHSEATRKGMTDDARKKISEALKGRVQSLEEKEKRSLSGLQYWTEENRKEHSAKFICENNPNSKLSHLDVIKCRVLSELFVISQSQIARILSLPEKATRHVISGGTWKEVKIKDLNGNLTNEAFLIFCQLLNEFSYISPSLKTQKRVKLTLFGKSDPKIVDVYNNWNKGF